MRTCLIIACFFLLIFSCKKEELETITGNQAPPDPTIEDVIIENYINKAFILTLGREASVTEFNTSRDLLKAAHIDSASRQEFLNGLFVQPDYLPYVYNQNRLSLLQNVDTSEFTGWIFIFQYYLQDSSFIFQWPVLEYELDRMIEMRDAYSLFTTGVIALNELQRRMCNNYLYDQINMGAANFVLSTFQHLINRNPTEAELSAGVSMVNGSNAIFFLQAGSSKEDYLDILTEGNSYYEGQVYLLYQKLLNRAPLTEEMAEGTLRFSAGNDYTVVQKDILSTDEFIGIE